MFKALLIEDNLLYRETLKEVLQQHFPILQIEEARDKERALQLAESIKPDLILMDIHLPTCNGLDLAKAIKYLHSQSVVIILSDHDLPEYRNAIQQFNADYFIPKHSPLEVLFTLVRGILTDKNMH